jgi:hypothetical protein
MKKLVHLDLRNCNGLATKTLFKLSFFPRSVSYALYYMPYNICTILLCPILLWPMPYNICPILLWPMPYNICPILLWPMPYNICPIIYALFYMPFALCLNTICRILHAFYCLRSRYREHNSIQQRVIAADLLRIIIACATMAYNIMTSHVHIQITFYCVVWVSSRCRFCVSSPTLTLRTVLYTIAG